MKHITSYLCVALIIAIGMSSCGTKKHALAELENGKAAATLPAANDAKAVNSAEFIKKINSNQLNTKNLIADLSLTITSGSKSISAPGALRMRKDEVIRIQAFIPLLGTEVMRIELTPTYVLFIDRLHKEYIKADYTQLEFLKNNSLDFYSLQALFWNEILVPGKRKMTDNDYNNFVVGNLVNNSSYPLSVKKGNINYKWLADFKTGYIGQADMSYVSSSHGSSELNWTYNEYKKVASGMFPTQQYLQLKTNATGKNRQMGVNMKLSDFKTSDKWDAQTEVSSKYKKVEPEQLLGKILSL